MSAPILPNIWSSMRERLDEETPETRARPNASESSSASLRGGKDERGAAVRRGSSEGRGMRKRTRRGKPGGAGADARRAAGARVAHICRISSSPPESLRFEPTVQPDVDAMFDPTPRAAVFARRGEEARVGRRRSTTSLATLF